MKEDEVRCITPGCNALLGVFLSDGQFEIKDGSKAGGCDIGGVAEITCRRCSAKQTVIARPNKNWLKQINFKG